MLRNEGGSLGIALAETMLARRSQFHRARLVGNTSEANPAFRDLRDRLTDLNVGAGLDPVSAGRRALAMIDGTIMEQSRLMAYLDIYWIFAVAAFASILVVFFMKRSVSSGGAAMQ